MRVYVIYSIALCILLWPASQTASALASKVGLENLLRQVWDKSVQLDAQNTQAELASGDRFRRFIFNEPQFQYSNSDDNTAHSYGLSLTTAFPGKTLAFTRLDAAKARAQRAEYLAKKYDLTKLITQSYLDCAAAQETYELQKITSADLDTVFQTLKALYETGHSTQAEKIGAELQSRQAKLDLRSAEDKEEVLCRKLDAVLAKASDGNVSMGTNRLALPDDLDEEFISDLGPNNSDQNRSIATIDVANANAYTAWWSQLPDLTFSVNRNHYIYLPGSPSGKEWSTSVGVSITVPILFPFHETVEAKRARSQAAIDQNVADLQRVAADSDQADGAKEYQRSRERLQELRAKDLALGEALVESTFSAYRSGKLGYAELVLSRKTLTDLRNQDIQLRASIVNAHLRCLTRCTGDETTPSTRKEKTL